MRRALRLLLLCGAVATAPGILAPALAPWASAQEEEDLTQGLRGMREAYDRARERVDELDFQAAVRELQGLIDSRKGVRAADLSLEETKVLCAAYDLRARAQFNLGNAKAAEADFEALVKLDPSYGIDRQTLSPKVVDLFDQVRRRLVGILRLQIDPPRARVLLDGEPIDAAAAGGIGLLAGAHELRVELEGYDPVRDTVSGVGGTEIRRAIRLRPNRRTLEFITVPAGVKITVDGAPAGSSAGPATPDVEALATQFNFDPKQASAPLSVPLVTPGEHKVAFERDCFVPQTLTIRVEIDPEQDRALRFAPVILQEARTELQISSSPSGADVLIDGVRQGATPLALQGLCGGERDIEVVKPEVGRWHERIRTTVGQVNTLSVRLRPTLLYAGTFRLDEWGRAVWSDEDKPLLDALGRGLKTLNLVRLPQVQDEIRSAIVKWMIADPREPRSGTLLPPEILKVAAERTGADLVLAGLTVADDPDHAWTLALYSVLHPGADIIRLRTDRDDGVRAFVERLDVAPPETRTWWGMGLSDSTLPPTGPVVVRVLPGSPAAKAGMRVGDRIQTVASTKVQGTRDTLKALEAESAKPGGVRAPVILTVEGGDGPRTARLAPDESPALPPMTEPGLLYNRALAEFRLRARAATEESARGVAYLNLGISFMHFRAYDKALAEGLLKADLPQGSGIAAGTVQYYRGLCALRRGDPETARVAFEAAVRAPGSTLDSGDGPSAAAAATRALAAMQ